MVLSLEHNAQEERLCTTKMMKISKRKGVFDSNRISVGKNCGVIFEGRFGTVTETIDPRKNEVVVELDDTPDDEPKAIIRISKEHAQQGHVAFFDTLTALELKGQRVRVPFIVDDEHMMLQGERTCD